MLFNSFIFIFIFLPITLIVYFRIGRYGYRSVAIIWLIIASLFFYGWWNPAYLGLILGSILFNYAISKFINRNINRQSIYVLVFGIAVNLGFLGYFKYANFFADNVNSLFATSFHVNQIIVPLAISFFTFQQIAYLVDSWRGETGGYKFLHYCLFVTFFPQLIAGPIVRHKETLPQFAKNIVGKLNYENLAVGLSLFILGLFKKVVIADTAVTYVTPFFDIATHGGDLTFVEGWVAALAYTFQLYFDFSGYSDMAIGLARMFGIVLPINFNSPYKAYNIIDFWRMWHITLSDWLRDYIFFPVRRSLLRKYRNKHTYLTLLVPPMITMLVSGLWHGAGWTFVLWGGLHGMYLVINQAWRTINSKLILISKFPLYLLNNISWLITFLSLVVAWVLFRAPTIHSALLILKAMFGFNGIVFSLGSNLSRREVVFFLLSSMFIVKFLPNSMDIISLYKPVLGKNYTKHKSLLPLSWKPTIIWGLFFVVLALSSLRMMITQGYHEFIYRFF
jgi:alginate O-acetyltransferase complex protein AlgI